jgi:hypothetical protein
MTDKEFLENALKLLDDNARTKQTDFIIVSKDYPEELLRPYRESGLKILFKNDLILEEK